MTQESQELARAFFAATCVLACHTGSLQQRLADAYADHLLQVVASDLPAGLQAAFRDVEQRLTAADADDGDDPFRAAAEQLNDDQARTLIEGIVMLYGRLAVHGRPS